MWEKVRLGDYIQLLGGGTPSKEVDSYWNGDIPWISVKDFKDDYIASTQDLITLEGVKNSATRIIPAGTLLVATRMAVGKVAINTVDAAINQDIKAIVCDKQLLAKFLFFFFKANERHLQSLASGATVKGIKINHITDLEIPFPPLPVQQRIADTLDKADALCRKDQELLKKYDELAQAIFIDMFGDPVKNEKGWAMKKLGEVCSKIGSGSTPRGGKEAYKSEGISLIRSLNIHQNEFRYKDLAFIDGQQAHLLRNVNVEENDILFNITGASVCRTTIVPLDVLPARVNQHVAILRPVSDQLNPYYFVRLLNNGNMNKLLYGIATQGGATREAITKEQLENLEFPVPPLTLQESFARKIELINQLKAKSDAEKSEELFQSLLQGVFRKTGELQE